MFVASKMLKPTNAENFGQGDDKKQRAKEKTINLRTRKAGKE